MAREKLDDDTEDRSDNRFAAYCFLVFGGVIGGLAALGGEFAVAAVLVGIASLLGFVCWYGPAISTEHASDADDWDEFFSRETPTDRLNNHSSHADAPGNLHHDEWRRRFDD